MKYPCSVIRDLLPLYHDGVCSEESRIIIEEHLTECPACEKYRAELCEAQELYTGPRSTERELEKAASLRAVRKTMRRKQILIAVLALAAAVILLLSAVCVLQHTERVIAFEDNLSVSMVDGSLVGRLRGNQANRVTVKRVETESGGRTETYLFFCLSGTAWDDFVTGSDVFSEYVLCPDEKGAETVDKVFYYTGDNTGLENLSGEELQKVIGDSVLLWTRN